MTRRNEELISDDRFKPERKLIYHICLTLNIIVKDPGLHILADVSRDTCTDTIIHMHADRKYRRVKTREVIWFSAQCVFPLLLKNDASVLSMRVTVRPGNRNHRLNQS